MLDEKKLLITGGTGSFGKKLLETINQKFPNCLVTVYSRDELKQSELKSKFPNVRFIIGDVRDKERLGRAMYGADYVIHAAALKQVPSCEINPFECVKTNVLGANNVIECATEAKVERVLALSTDKAAGAINLYGATKLCADKMFMAANLLTPETIFSSARYGNVMGSRGSIMPYFIEQKKNGLPLTITDNKMTRFNITLDEAVNFVIHCLETMLGGEIFVPKMQSYRVLDVAEAVDPGGARIVTGIRPGEKVNEDIIHGADALNTLDCGSFYVIKPSWESFDKYQLYYLGRPCSAGFQYSSNSSRKYLSVDRLRTLIKENVK